MKKKFDKEITLNDVGVDDASREIETWLGEMKVPRRDALSLRLTMEEMLLRISRHFEGNVSGTLTFGRRLGVPFIRFRYKADPYDPTKTQDDELGMWAEKVYARMGLSPSWSYRFGSNSLTQNVSERKNISQILLLAAFLAAILLGVLGAVLPEEIKNAVSGCFLEPVSDIFMRLLRIFVGPLVFVSVVSGICGIGTASEFGRIGKQMFVRYIGLTFIGSAACLMCLPVFQLGGSVSTQADTSQTSGIRDMLLNVFPSNLIQPFLEGSTLQIIFLSVFVGVILLGMGEKSARLKDLLIDLNELVDNAIRVVCNLLPVFIFASFTMQIWNSGLGTLLGFWKPIALTCVLCIVFFCFKTAVVCIRLKVSPILLVRKIFPSMLIGFTTASGSSAFSVISHINVNKLGIPKQIDRIGHPIASVMYGSVYAILFVMTSLYSAEAYGAGGGFGWFIMLWLVGAIMCFTVPPVSGGVLACVGVMFIQLKIPEQAMAAAGVLILFLDFICTGFSLGVKHLELVLQSDHLGMLNREMLESKETI